MAPDWLGFGLVFFLIAVSFNFCNFIGVTLRVCCQRFVAGCAWDRCPFCTGKISDLLVGCRLLRLTLAPAEVNRRRFSDSRGIKMEPAVRLVLVTGSLLLVEKS